MLVLQNGDHFAPPAAPTSGHRRSVATKSQRRIRTTAGQAPNTTAHINQFIKLSIRTCGPYLAGMPEVTSYIVCLAQLYIVSPNCPAQPVAPGIIVWPESPAPFFGQ